MFYVDRKEHFFQIYFQNVLSVMPFIFSECVFVLFALSLKLFEKQEKNSFVYVLYKRHLIFKSCFIIQKFIEFKELLKFVQI